MATQYTLKIKNNSTIDGSICVYQKDPQIQANRDVYSLAWFSKRCNINTSIKFQWTIDYSFMWSETGILAPGVSFEASEIKEADPSVAAFSSITLSNPNGYKFTDPTVTAPSGSMLIHVDSNVPNDDVSIGIGMSGKAAFAKNAKTNMNFTFSPHPEYWVVFGDYEEGDVMDFNLSSSSYKISFPVNVYSKCLSFNPDNTFSETTLKERNSLIRASKLW